MKNFIKNLKNKLLALLGKTMNNDINVSFEFKDKKYSIIINESVKCLDSLKDKNETILSMLNDEKYNWDEFFEYLPKSIKVNNFFINSNFNRKMLQISNNDKFDNDEEDSVLLLRVQLFSLVKHVDEETYIKLMPIVYKVFEYIQTQFQEEILLKKQEKENLIKKKKQNILNLINF